MCIRDRQNYQMKVIEHKDGKLQYTYKVKKGISNVQGAICILEDMKYPNEIINDVKNFDIPQKAVKTSSS